MMQKQYAPLAVANTCAAKTLLLKLGDSEDGLYYHAAIGSSPSIDSYVVYLHQRSSVLERLRLHGSLKVMTQLVDGSVFRAELSMIDEGAHDETIGALLSLLESVDTLIAEPRLLPLT
jgi:hypothetical protein